MRSDEGEDAAKVEVLLEDSCISEEGRRLSKLIDEIPLVDLFLMPTWRFQEGEDAAKTVYNPIPKP